MFHINPVRLGKNSALAVGHLASGNPVAAGLSAIKAGSAFIPVVAHLPGVEKMVDSMAGNPTDLTPGEYHQLQDKLDVDHDGDVDFDDVSDILHHAADNISNFFS